MQNTNALCVDGGGAPHLHMVMLPGVNYKIRIPHKRYGNKIYQFTNG